MSIYHDDFTFVLKLVEAQCTYERGSTVMLTESALVFVPALELYSHPSTLCVNVIKAPSKAFSLKPACVCKWSLRQLSPGTASCAIDVYLSGTF